MASRAMEHPTNAVGATVENSNDSNSDGRVIEPNEIDILFGRGKGVQNHPGNKRMRAIVSKSKKIYQSLGRGKKQEVVKNVYDELVEGGARFLKRLDNTAWIAVDLDNAITKLRHTLRGRESRQRKIHASDGAGDCTPVDHSAISSHATVTSGLAQSSCPVALQRASFGGLDCVGQDMPGGRGFRIGNSEAPTLDNLMASVEAQPHISQNQLFQHRFSQHRALNLGLGSLNGQYFGGLNQYWALSDAMGTPTSVLSAAMTSAISRPSHVLRIEQLLLDMSMLQQLEDMHNAYPGANKNSRSS